MSCYKNDDTSTTTFFRVILSNLYQYNVNFDHSVYYILYASTTPERYYYIYIYNKRINRSDYIIIKKVCTYYI